MKKFYEIENAPFSCWSHICYLTSMKKAKNYIEANLKGKVGISIPVDGKPFDPIFKYYNNVAEIPVKVLAQASAIFSDECPSAGYAMRIIVHTFD